MLHRTFVAVSTDLLMGIDVAHESCFANGRDMRILNSFQFKASFKFSFDSVSGVKLNTYRGE